MKTRMKKIRVKQKKQKKKFLKKNLVHLMSKRRAASVKTFLTSEFEIDASRMKTDGKGEGQPIENNSTAEGKA